MRKICTLTSMSFAVIFMSWFLSGAGTAWADGTETLGPPSGLKVEPGSGIAVGGSGLFSQPGTFTVKVPQGATVKQVLLYWEGQSRESEPGDDTIVINGNDVQGELIGGPTRFFADAHSSSFRADITDLGLVGAGTTPLSVEGLTFTRRNNGVGVIVIYQEEGRSSEIILRDGNDLAFVRFPGPLKTTVPQRYTFPASTTTRTATFAAMAGSVANDRPNAVAITVDGTTTKRRNLLGSFEGEEWDTVTIPIEVPAGATSITLQLLSEGDATDRVPASLAWVAGALSVPTPTPAEISVDLVKTNDANGDGVFSDDETAPAAGGSVPFRVVVTNPGDVPVVIDALTDEFGATTLDLLTGRVVAGPATVSSNSCGALAAAVIRPNSSTLSTGVPASCTFTLADYAPQAGTTLPNTARVRVSEQGDPSNRAGAVDSSTVRSTTTPEPDEPAIALIKEATLRPDDRGLKVVTYDENDGREETVTYVFTVTNTGSVPLTNVTLTDNLLGEIPLSKTTLQPGETATGTATYTVTRADAAAGRIDNIATVSGIAPDGRRVQARDPEVVHVAKLLKPPVRKERPEVEVDQRPTEPKERVQRRPEKRERLADTGAGVGALGGSGGLTLLAGLFLLGLGRVEGKRSRRGRHEDL
ncbi:MAG: hypothetical protein ABR592_09770 [Nitriliruptorales bacterium]